MCRAEIGLPQGGALGVKADGHGQLARLCAGLADFQIGLPVKEVLEQRPDHRGRESRVEGRGSICAWRMGEGTGELVERLALEFGALGQLPERHQAGRVGLGVEALLAQPVKADDGLGCGRGRLGERGRRLRGVAVATDTGRRPLPVIRARQF